MTTPNPVGPGGFFSLFDLPPTIYKAEALERLGTAMATARVSSGASPIPSGYVYFGQMVAHDITKLQKPLPGVNSAIAPEVEHLVQLRTPSLDLDCVYGTGFEDETVAIDERTGEMKLGPVAGTDVVTLDDLPRRRGSPMAHIPDDRNDENLLLAQLHVLFLKLHNYFVRQIRAEKTNLEPRQLFEEARTQVILHYQQIVLYDFLVEICDPRVWEYVIGNNRGTLWDPIIAEETRMPVELSAAALRFGHSMVRGSYEINDRGDVATLADLFAMTGQGGLGGKNGLPATHVVDWRLFFNSSGQVTGHAANLGLAIDPVVPIKLPPPVNSFLATKNLNTGNLSHLPDGQTLVRHIAQKYPVMARALNLDVLKPDDLDTEVNFDVGDELFQEGRLLTQVGLAQGFTIKTPLWYYLLAEAKATCGGQHLGVLGSLLVADLLRALVRLSSPSVLPGVFESRYIVPTRSLNGRICLTMMDLVRTVTSLSGTNSVPRRAA